AALSRPEGVLLFVVFVALSAMEFLSARLPPKRVLWHSAAALVPFLVVVGGYLGVYGMRTASFTLGAAERSYLAFEQGHGIAFRPSAETLNPVVYTQNGTPRQ